MTESLQANRDNRKIEQIEGHNRLLQAYEIYNKLANEKIQDFKIAKEYLSEVLEKLLQEERIGRGTVMLSRIKSPSSVVRNWKLGKKLDDIFGISIVTNNSEEIEQIRAEIRQQEKFGICSKKERNEKRGYEAIHFCFDIGENKKKTKVECHLQTHEAYKNVYTHIFYKVRTELGRDSTLEEENVISAKIQQMYETGKLGGFELSGNQKSRIPQMWVASFNPDGKMEEMQLSEDVIVTIMYPFLDLSKKKNTPSNTGNEEIEL